MRVNLDGVFLGTKFAIAAMKKSGGGSITNIASLFGPIGNPDAAAYHPSKGGAAILQSRCYKGTGQLASSTSNFGTT